MTEVVSDWISMAVSTGLTAIIILGVVTASSAFGQMNRKVTSTQALTLELKEYRKHNQFDNTQVRPQDVITAIYKSRGYPTIYLKSSKGTFAWTSTDAPCEYNAEAISRLIDQTVVYQAALRKGANGEITAYEFVAR